MHPGDKLLVRYIAAGACYGFARKTLDVSVNRPTITVERKYVSERSAYVARDRPMLFTEKVIAVSAHTCLCAGYWPYFVASDLNRVEARVRGIDIDPTRGNDDPEHSVYSRIVS